MKSVYNLCMILIRKGKTDGLMDKMDAYLAADRLTPDEYQALVELMDKQ